MVADASPELPAAGSHLGLVPPASEKRLGGDRRGVMIPATILCADGAIYACVIRDMSPTGAKIGISRRHRLPADFMLAIPGRDFTYRVMRMWQRGDFAGVLLAKPDR